ncbi:MAG TPA: hypothetical protein VFS05_17065 [Gemmatimonadaceae bacterium]|nr:hypothetical protein [Gemmatimonadaceae bacterium]
MTSAAIARLTMATAVAAALFVARPGGADAQQRRPRPWAGLAVPTKVAVVVAGRRYESRVEAQCEFDERAAPGSPRWQWNVLYPPFGVQSTPAVVRAFALDIWRGRGGDATNRLSFSATVNGASYLIQTYGSRIGQGTVRVTRPGAGARFEVEGRDAKGVSVRATIECERVRKPEATGG